MTELKKRTWHYLLKPSVFEISGCSCGNEDTQWSEYVKHLWCDKCNIDFIPEHNGVFDGPIPINAAQMLGLDFSIYNMETQRVEVVDSGARHLEYQTQEEIFQNKKVLMNLRSKDDSDFMTKAYFNTEDETIVVQDDMDKDGYFEAEIAIGQEIQDCFNPTKFKLDVKCENGIFSLIPKKTTIDFQKYILQINLNQGLVENPGLKKSKI